MSTTSKAGFSSRPYPVRETTSKAGLPSPPPAVRKRLRLPSCVLVSADGLWMVRDGVRLLRCAGGPWCVQGLPPFSRRRLSLGDPPPDAPPIPKNAPPLPPRCLPSASSDTEMPVPTEVVEDAPPLPPRRLPSASSATEMPIPTEEEPTSPY